VAAQEANERGFVVFRSYAGPKLTEQIRESPLSEGLGGKGGADRMGRRWGMDFDEEQLRRLIRGMTPRSQFYKTLREELRRVGRWKNLPRGMHVASRRRQSPGSHKPRHSDSITVRKNRNDWGSGGD